MGGSLKKLKIELPYDTAILLLGICPKEIKPVYQRIICTLMFNAAQFTIAKKWKQPKCMLTDEWIRTMWYIWTMKHLSFIYFILLVLKRTKRMKSCF
jgi:hypothetical protein